MIGEEYEDSGDFAVVRLVAALCLSAALLWPPPALATVLRDMSIEELAVAADAVVRGEVRGVESRLVDEGRRVLTLVTVDVSTSYTGAIEKTIELIVPGGAHGELAQETSGVPSFSVADEVVLFLELHPGAFLRPRFTLSSMGLGAFVVREELATRQTRGLKVVTGPLDDPRPLPRAERIMPVSVLEERVRAALPRSTP